MNNKFGFIVSLIVVFISGVSLGNNIAQKAVLTENKAETASLAQTVSIMLDKGEGKIRIFDNMAVAEGETLYALLKNVGEKNKIELLTKDYGGELGVYVRSVDGAKEGDGKFWQYWVNNKYSQTGVSNYKPVPGDVIEFKLTKGQINQ